MSHIRDCKSGATKAAKKAGNVAAEGAILVATSEDGKSALLLENMSIMKYFLMRLI